MAEGYGKVEKLIEKFEVVDKHPEETALVKIGTEEFSIVQVPSSKTTVVAEQKELLLESFELDVLVEELGHVGNFVRIAYNGVAGYTELQIKVREIGYDVTRLCDKSAITVSKFKQASGSILEDLQGTYQFLLDGMENIALVTLASVSEVAQDIAPAVEQLHREFEEESHKVEAVLMDATRERGKEAKMKREIEEKNRKYEDKKHRAEKRKKSSELKFAKSERWYRKAEESEANAQYQPSARNPLRFLVKAFTAPVGFEPLNEEDDEGMAPNPKKYREEKLKALEDMKKQRNLQYRAIRDIADCVKQMKHCTDNSELVTVAIDALHQAMGGLQKLSLVMLKIANFWKQLQAHCETLTKDKMQSMVTRAMEWPERKRLRVWTSTVFKMQAIAYYAQWVALDDVCAVYMMKIKQTQTALYGYLTENPTVEEARANVRQLAVTFGEDLKKAQDEIGRKDADDERERARILKIKGPQRSS